MFARLMSEFLRDLKLPKMEGPQQEICTLHFQGKPDVHFINHLKSYVDVVCEAGMTADVNDSKVLLKLLALNRVNGNEIPAVITLHEETRTIVVWCRHPITNLTASTLRQALHRVMEKASAVRDMLKNPAENLARGKNENTLARLARFTSSDPEPSAS